MDTMVHRISTVTASEIIKNLFDDDPELLVILHKDGSKRLSEVLKEKYHCIADPDWLLNLWDQYYRDQAP